MYVVVSISNLTVHVWSPIQERRGSLGARYEDRVNKSLTGFVHTSRPAQADGRAWRSVGQLARSSPLAKINELLWISSVMTRPRCGCFVKPQMAWTGRRDMFCLSSVLVTLCVASGPNDHSHSMHYPCTDTLHRHSTLTGRSPHGGR